MLPRPVELHQQLSPVFLIPLCVHFLETTVLPVLSTCTCSVHCCINPTQRFPRKKSTKTISMYKHSTHPHTPTPCALFGMAVAQQAYSNRIHTNNLLTNSTNHSRKCNPAATASKYAHDHMIKLAAIYSVHAYASPLCLKASTASRAPPTPLPSK